MKPEHKIFTLSKIGPKTHAKLNRLGIETITDLLFYFPRRYHNFSQITPICEIGPRIGANDFLTVQGTISGIANKKTRRRGFTVTEAVVVDATGAIKVVWFNQPYLSKMLQAGKKLILSGRVHFDRFTGGMVMESALRSNKLEILPVYGETTGLSSFFISKLVKEVAPLIEEIPEYFPEEFLKDAGLIGLREAIKFLHWPKKDAEISDGRMRVAFDELFFISLRANLARLERTNKKAPQIEADIEKLKSIIKTLPYQLTGDQKKALWQIVKDMALEKSMSRLLNGDVGSGKTIVAALAAWLAVEAGYQVLLMAPTGILAAQHLETFKKLFGDKMKIGFVTASNNSSAERAEASKCDIIIGTHALLNLPSLENVGLVIVDEQHRFGVNQRAALLKLANKGLPNLSPHFLSMTATPIPRTLQLALFGDLDISVLLEKPAGREEIKTRLVEEQNRAKAYEFIKNQLQKGHQAFVICPLIEEAEREENLLEIERKSVKAEFEKLKDIFNDFKVGVLHGKMKQTEKDKAMADFQDQKYDILVSTSVIEVGVDIPNATVMLIEDANRFGLAQIHQFRGRVGRSIHQSYCFLFTQSQADTSIKRLKALEETSDGFKLAELDLSLRGPGAIFGVEQSGLIDLKMASISDRILLEKASALAKMIAPKIDKYPKLKEKLSQIISQNHME